MRRQYSLSPESRRQVAAIGDFIAEDSIDAALTVYDALEQAFELLAENPDIGHSREDLTARPVKFWSVFSYLVVYDPASSPLEIIAVIHSARDVARVLTEDRSYCSDDPTFEKSGAAASWLLVDRI